VQDAVTEKAESKKEQTPDVDRDCDCGEHEGKELVDIQLSISPETAYKNIFTYSDFARQFWTNRKMKNTTIGEWSSGGGEAMGRMRTFKYSIDIGALGKANNLENQTLLEYDPTKSIVLDSVSSTSNVPYSDSFQVHNRFCMTRCVGNTCRLRIHSRVNYIKNTNFLVKSFIEKNAFSNLKDSYGYLKKNLAEIKQEVDSVEIGEEVGLLVVTTPEELDESKVTRRKCKLAKKRTNLNRPLSEISSAIVGDVEPVRNVADTSEEYTESSETYLDGTSRLFRMLVLL